MATVSYTSLEPSTFTASLSKEGQPLGFDTGSAVTLLSSTNFLWSAGIMISVVAAGFMYMRAGIIRMQASEVGVRKSNEEIKRVTLGLLGVLSLFVILYTFNKGLLRGDVGLEGLQVKPVGSSVGPVAGTESTGNTPPAATVGTGPEDANRKILTDAGISINKPACVGSSTDCTNVGGINPASLTVLLKLKSECNCDVQVTGGTEGGHSANSNHGVGKEAIDISLTSALSSFFQKSGTVIGNTPPCNIKYGYGGFIFWDEAQGCDSVGGVRHFHASFTGR